MVQLSMSLPSVPPCRLVHGLTPPVALELVAQAVLSAGGRSRSRGGAAQQRGASGASGQRLPVPGSPVCTPPRHPPARPAAHPARPRLRPAPRASPPCLPFPVPPPPPPRSPPPGHPVPSRRAPFRARCLPRAQPQAPAQFPSSPAHAAPGQPPCLGSRSRGGAAQQRGASGVERTAAPRARFPRARQVPACSCPPSRQLRSCHVHFFMFFFFIFYRPSKMVPYGPKPGCTGCPHGPDCPGVVVPVLVFPHERSSMHTFCTSMHTFCTPFHRSGPRGSPLLGPTRGACRQHRILVVNGVRTSKRWACDDR